MAGPRMGRVTAKPKTEVIAKGRWSRLAPSPLRDQYDWLPTLPTVLLGRLKEADDIRHNRRSPQLFTDETYELERELAKAAEAIPFGVGIRFEEIVTAPALYPVEASLTVSAQERDEIVAYCREQGINPLVIQDRLTLLDQVKHISAVAHAAHGGFLMCQPRFHKEYRELKAAIIEKMHLPRRYVDTMSIVQLGAHTRGDPMLILQEHFLPNWGIRLMKAPYVFDFDGPLLGFPADIVAMLRPTAVVQAWPASLPAPARQVARDAVATRSETDRLAEFRELADSPGSNQRLLWLGQLYRIQHYWRALTQRYEAQLKGNRNRFLSCIIQFVTDTTSEPSRDAVHRVDSALKLIENLTSNSPKN
jgi:hypothetical protein